MNARTLPIADEHAPVLPRAFRPVLTAVLLAALLAVSMARLWPWLDRPVRELRIVGVLTWLTPAQLAAAAAIAPGTRLFAVDLAAVRARVAALPWVAQVRVTRRWPEAIELRVWQRQPYARWDSDHLLDDQGVVFAPPPADLQNEAFKNLPRLSGPPGREAEVMQDYRRWTSALAGGPFAPVGLRLDARGAWTLTAANGIELRLGEGDALAKLPLLTGVVARTLAGRMADVAYVDLRYSNGFAVGWVSARDCGLPAASRASANAAPGPARQGCTETAKAAPGTAAESRLRPTTKTTAAHAQEKPRE